MGKYFNRGTLDAECFGKLFQYKDAQVKSGGKFYNPENLIENFYEYISTRKDITEQQKAWFAEQAEIAAVGSRLPARKTRAVWQKHAA